MKHIKQVVLATALVALSSTVNAACSDIPYATFQSAANSTLAAGITGGFGLNMWATFVDETGKVCAVVNTGAKGALAGNSQWLGSRVISAQKANTSNAFSLDGVAISSGALYAPVQPGGSLFGLQESNPVDANTAYQGTPATYGTVGDPLVGKRVGGINVFGGGLPLYKNGKKIGAIGVSGDSSCTDHAFAWNIRSIFGLTPDTQVGKFEKLHLTNIFAGLGDHPDCGSPGSDRSGFVTAP